MSINFVHEKKLQKPQVSSKQKVLLVLFGFFLSFGFLEAGLRLGGFVLLSIQEHGNSQSLKQKSTYRILCLGESTTQGQYPRFLEQVLNQHNVGVRFSVIDKGKGGTDTSTILSHVESYLTEYHPDMVVAMMGVNDGGAHMPFEAATTSKGILFMRSFRTYKLIKLLGLHLATKAKEMGLYKPDEDGRSSGKAQPYLPGAGLKESYNESVLTEDSFKKAIELDPKNDDAYIDLGRSYREQGKFSQAEDSFKKAIELNPKNDFAYAELGRLYREQGELSLVEDLIEKAIELNPKNDFAYLELGRLYQEQGKFPQFEDLIKKAIELNPKNDEAYVDLGWLYHEQGKSSQVEDMIKKAVELNPKNDYAYIELGRFYREQGKFSQAEDSFKKAVEANPQYDKSYFKLGWFYWEQGKFSQAEDSFKKAIELNPENDNAYVELGGFYREQDKFSQAIDPLKKAIGLNPKNDFTYVELGRSYREQGEFSQAEDFFKKAIELNPKNDNAYVELGRLYRDKDKFSQAEDAFKKAIELNPRNDNAYFKLGGLYREQGRFFQAEDTFKKGIELNPRNDRIFGVMASLYEEMGEHKSAREYAEKVNTARLKYYSLIAVSNYRELKEILDKRGIRLVCVQYPVRNVEPLKEIFGKDEGIIFVDNERVFKEAMKKSSYREYFVDIFGGEFGHCTQKGNKLLAQNIAEVILGEVFNK